MAAANSSPVNRGRTTRHDVPQVPASMVNGTGTQHRGHQRSGTVNTVHPSGHTSPHLIESRTDFTDISDDQMYLPDMKMRNGNAIHRVHFPVPTGPAEGQSHPDEVPSSSTCNYEVQHLRTQLKSVVVLQELLADQRSELQLLQEVVEELLKTGQRVGLEYSSSLQEKLSRLKLSPGAYSIPDSEWSVELKRPPSSSLPSQRDGNDLVALLKEQIRHKEDKIKLLEEEVSNYQHLLESSEDDKSREIARLKDQLHHRSQDCQTSEAICQSLSGETELLRTKIQVLVEKCQALTTEMDQWKKKKLTGKAIPGKMPETPVSPESQLKIAKQQVIQLDREKGQLAGQLKEVIRMNKRWQKYNRQQDILRDEVERAKTELETRIKVLELQLKDYEDLANKLRQELKENETRHRHQQVDVSQAAEKDIEIHRLRRDVNRLEQELRKAGEENSKYDKEVVRHQLMQFSEDFKKEHLEKEKLKRENAILNRNHLEAEELVRQLNINLELAERENRELKQDIRRKAAYMREMNIQRERRELTPHGVITSSPENSFDYFPTLPKDVERDGCGNAQPGAPSASPSHSPASPSPSPISPPISPPPSNPRGEDFVDGDKKEGQGLHSDNEDPLQCPRCLREFPVSKHSDFMRHVEQCLDM